MSEDVLYGWFSEQADVAFGSAIYSDERGNRVFVSEVTTGAAKPISTWADLRLIGRVLRCVDHTPKRKAYMQIMDEDEFDQLGDGYSVNGKEDA